MKAKLLYVDDEARNLMVFNSLLRQKYNVLLSPTVKGAYELLAANKDVAVVIADERMPEERGVWFLEKVKNECPECIRILLTGFADMEVLENAINRSGISFFIEKPWKESMLLSSIENAVDLYHSRQELRQKNLELQKANDALNRFTYSASHEMRSPLTNILGIVKVSRLQNDINELRNYFNLIETAVIHLDNFIKNLIGYHKNAGMELLFADVDMREIVEEVINTFLFLEGAQDIQYKINVVQQVPFITDMNRIKMVFSNLITNAVKFRKDDGSVSYISIEVMVDEEKALISISDNGIGINEEDQHMLFNMFNRSLHPRSGTGIGLFIVKETVEKLGGEIHLTSQKEIGTTFNIIIPNHRM